MFAEMRRLQLFPDLNQNMHCNRIPRRLVCTVLTRPGTDPKFPGSLQLVLHLHFAYYFVSLGRSHNFSKSQIFSCKIEKIIVAKLNNTAKFLAQLQVHRKLW
ncbi:hypothetical protein VULLAG_LOCUS725 [Vulpes lagopus]